MIKSMTNSSWCTFRLVVKNGDGSACTGSVTYETEYAFLTEDDAYILDIGKPITSNGY